MQSQSKPTTSALAGPEPKYLRVKFVAQKLDVHPSTIYRAIETKQLRAVRLGSGRGGLRIPREAFEEFVRAAATVPAEDIQAEVA